MGQQAMMEELTGARRSLRKSCGDVTPRARGEAHPHGLEWTKSHDQELAEAVSLALHAMNDQRVRPVSPRVCDGRVWLCGRVRTYYAKQLAIHAAMSVAGVERLFDDVVVD